MSEPTPIKDRRSKPDAQKPASNKNRTNRKPQRAAIVGKLDINVLLSFVFGVIFLSIMLGFAVYFPNPTPFQIKVFMTALSLAGAGVGAVLPGFIKVEYQNILRAGGALALFVIIWFFQPVIESNVVQLEAPAGSPEPIANEFLAALDRHDLQQTFSEFDPAMLEITGATKQTWEQIYNANFGGLGELQKRQFMGLQAVTSPPGYPIGLYRQLTYLAKYSSDLSCRAEAVILRATQQKEWKVAAINIAPNPVPCPSSF